MGPRLYRRHFPFTFTTYRSRDIKKKNLNLKTKIVLYCSVQRVGTVDSSLSLVRPPEIEISKKKVFGTKNENARVLVQVKALLTLSPFFSLCDL